MAKKITIQQASVICYTLRTHEEGNGTLDISICQLIGEEPNTLHIEYWRDMGGQYGRCYRDEVVPMDAEISWDEQKRQVVHCPPRGSTTATRSSWSRSTGRTAASSSSCTRGAWSTFGASSSKTTASRSAWRTVRTLLAARYSGSTPPNYVVSGLVKSAVTERKDLLVPGGQVRCRDNASKILGCLALNR